MDEVTSLTIDGLSTAPCYSTECTLEQFSYRGGNNLFFSVEFYTYQEAWGGIPPTRTYSQWTVENGGGSHVYRYCSQMCNSVTSTDALEDTTLTVTAAVPEPGTYLMLASGLLGMGYLARRQRRPAFKAT